MKNTRAHAPIEEVLDAAGVPSYIPRGIQSHDDEDRWMMRRDRSLERMQAKRDKRRCDEPDWCGDDTTVEERSQETGGGTTSWESRGRGRSPYADADDEDAEVEARRRVREARIRAKANNLKKAPRSYHVANPDRNHTPSSEKYAVWHPDRRPTVSSRKSAEHDEAYMLTQEVLSYSFGGNQ